MHGTEIRKLRKRFELPMPDFARLLNIPSQIIYDWERGCKTPDAGQSCMFSRLWIVFECLCDLMYGKQITHWLETPNYKLSPGGLKPIDCLREMRDNKNWIRVEKMVRDAKDVMNEACIQAIRKI